MGIFDIFKKGNSERVKAHPEIKISKTDYGSHGDNFGGLIGFNSVNDEIGRIFINAIIAKSMTEETELRTKDYELKSTSISDNPKLKLRVLTDSKNVISAFPYLQTNYKIPYSTKDIKSIYPSTNIKVSFFMLFLA